MSRSDSVVGLACGRGPQLGLGHAQESGRWRVSSSICRPSTPRVRIWRSRGGFWWRLPAAWQRSAAGTAYGTHVHALVLKFAPREQNHSTFFFRNRPELELLKRLLGGVAKGARLELAVLGCSNGRRSVRLRLGDSLRADRISRSPSRRSTSRRTSSISPRRASTR